MTMATRQERRAESIMRAVTGLGGLMAVSLVMAALEARRVVDPARMAAPQAAMVDSHAQA